MGQFVSAIYCHNCKAKSSYTQDFNEVANFQTEMWMCGKHLTDIQKDIDSDTLKHTYTRDG